MNRETARTKVMTTHNSPTPVAKLHAQRSGRDLCCMSFVLRLLFSCARAHQESSAQTSALTHAHEYFVHPGSQDRKVTP